MSGKIQFFSEGCTFRPKHPVKLRSWLRKIISSEGSSMGDLNFIFCPDEVLLKMNEHYLQHDTFTDIITFDHSDGEPEISGDIFISIDRVRENAIKYATSFPDELHRVMAHGILHLLGYGDKTTKEKRTMREKEAACLSLRDLPSST